MPLAEVLKKYSLLDFISLFTNMFIMFVLICIVYKPTLHTQKLSFVGWHALAISFPFSAQFDCQFVDHYAHITKHQAQRTWLPGELSTRKPFLFRTAQIGSNNLKSYKYWVSSRSTTWLNDGKLYMKQAPAKLACCRAGFSNNIRAGEKFDPSMAKHRLQKNILGWRLVFVPMHGQMFQILSLAF